MLEVLPRERGGGVSIVGELDISTVENFRATLDALPAQQTSVLDLAELSFVDVVGLHAVEDHARMLNGTGPLVLENVSTRIRRLFDIVGAGEDSRLEFRS